MHLLHRDTPLATWDTPLANALANGGYEGSVPMNRAQYPVICIADVRQ